MIVREFNQTGIDALRTFLAQCRKTPSTIVPYGMLEDDKLTQEVRPRIVVEPKRLKKKADAAYYLGSALNPMPDSDLIKNAGLWTWLTLFYFEEVCPVTSSGRTVRNDYHYVFEPGNTRHFYRHLLFISWRVLHLASEHSRLFLGSPLSTLDKVTTEVMKRLFLTRIPCIFEVLDRLYWDEDRGRARPGIVGARPAKRGDLTHRLPIRIRQLEKTYDLLTLNADQLIELLGAEFHVTSASCSAYE